MGSDGSVGFVEGETEGPWRRDSLSLRHMRGGGEKMWHTQQSLRLKQGWWRRARNVAATSGYSEGFQPHQIPCPFCNSVMKITDNLIQSTYNSSKSMLWPSYDI